MNYNPLQKVFRDVDKIKIGPMITPTTTTTTTIVTTTTTTTTTPTIYTVVDTMDSDDGMNEYKDDDDDDEKSTLYSNLLSLLRHCRYATTFSMDVTRC